MLLWSNGRFEESFKLVKRFATIFLNSNYIEGINNVVNRCLFHTVKYHPFEQTESLSAKYLGVIVSETNFCYTDMFILKLITIYRYKKQGRSYFWKYPETNSQFLNLFFFLLHKKEVSIQKVLVSGRDPKNRNWCEWGQWWKVARDLSYASRARGPGFCAPSPTPPDSSIPCDMIGQRIQVGLRLIRHFKSSL